MGIVKKYRFEILAAIAISALYFFLRLIFLTRLPIFTDEAIYIRWAQIALHDANWRFISLTDGKQPLFVWFAIVAMRFIHDPLLASRLVSVGSGFFTMLGVWILTYEVFKNRTIAFLAMLTYVLFPFAQVYDRMALMDGMVGTFYVWSLYFSILLVRKVRLDLAYTLGFVIGGGVLTKSVGFLSIYLLPFTLLLFNFKKKPVLKRLIWWGIFAAVAAFVAEGMYMILRLSPFFEMIDQKTATFVYPMGELARHPYQLIVGSDFRGPFWRLFSNFRGIGDWLFQYLKPTFVILILIALFAARGFKKEKLLLIIYFLLPFLGLMVLGITLFPRFLYSMSLPLLPLVALGLYYSANFVYQKLSKKKNLPLYYATMLIMCIIFLGYSGYVSYQFANDPINADIAKPDNGQYVNNWTAGWGIAPSVAFFRKEAQDQKIFIATEGTFGMLPEALELYLVQNPNITIKGYWPFGETIPEDMLMYAKKMPSYFVVFQKENLKKVKNYPLTLIFKVKDAKSPYYYYVYQIMPPGKKI